MKIKEDLKKLVVEGGYSPSDPLMEILTNNIPLALEEIIDNCPELLNEALNNTQKEEELRKKVFTGEGFEISKIASAELNEYRVAGRDFLRTLAFTAERVFSKAAGIKQEDIETLRLIYVVGLSPYGKHYFEDGRALIKVQDWSLVKNISNFLEERVNEFGRAFLKQDLIYSHRKEERYDDKGYLLDKEGKRQKNMQVAEGVMFVKKQSSDEKKAIEEEVLRKFALKITGNKNISNTDLSKLREDLEHLLHVGELNNQKKDMSQWNDYTSLYDAFFQSIAYTVTIEDLFDFERINDIKKKTTLLGKYLSTHPSFKEPIAYLEDIVYNDSRISPPLGVSLFGWKSQSLADKLIIATYYGVIRENEEELKSYLKKNGISPQEGHYSRRSLFDSLRATFITYGKHQKPFTYDKSGMGIPQRDEDGEKIAYDLFSYLHDLNDEDTNRIKLGQKPEAQPSFSKFGLICNWKKEKDFENYLHQRKENGFGSLNTTVKFSVRVNDCEKETNVEIDYRPDVEDRRSLTGDQDHAIYKIEQQLIVDWLVYEKKVISPEELLVLRMLISPNNQYLHF